MPPGCQSLLAFEQAAVDAAQASAHAGLQANLAAKAQRAMLKRQAELDKANRRFKRDEKRKEKTPNEYAQCGILWYCRSSHNVALGNYWKRCHACGRILIYTSEPNARPQVCAGRKP